MDKLIAKIWSPEVVEEYKVDPITMLDKEILINSAGFTQEEYGNLSNDLDDLYVAMEKEYQTKKNKLD